MENNEQKKSGEKPISVGDVSGDVVISQNQSGGITAHTVNLNKEKELNEADKIALLQFIKDLKTKLNFNPTGFTISMVNNSNGNKIASQIEGTLKANGYNMIGNGYGYMMRAPGVNGIEINKSRQGDHLEILVGQIS
jgi:hypothetical protein